MNKEYKGFNGTMVLTDTGIVIKRGVTGFLFGGGMLRGDKTIPYSSIVAVQLKKAGMMQGYLQLTLTGGSEAKGGVFQSTTDENTVNFRSSSKNALFLEAKEIIEKEMTRSKGGHHARSEADDLEKYSELRDKGVISEEEFKAKKRQILGV